MLSNTRGNKTFHPTSISWSYLGRGRDALIRMKMQIKMAVLKKNQNAGGKNAGPSQPPKKRVAMSAEIRVTPIYSPTKNIPNFIPEYSE
jgi:hypothetical protein